MFARKNRISKQKEFDNILQDNDLTRKDFANLSGIQYTTVGKWNDKDRPIPAWVESWLQNYIKAKDIDKIAQTIKPYINYGES